MIGFRQMTKPDFFEGFPSLLKSISDAVPTVTLWGEGDPYVADHYANELLARKNIPLPKVGHWVPLVAPDKLADQIRQ